MPERSNAILVTGGAGFIGRALVQVSLENGCRVAVYDNLSFGRKSNLTPFQDEIIFFEGDIRDEKVLDQAWKAFKPECVIHLAALHFIPYCDAHPKETLEVNVGGTHAVLNACVRWGVRTTVFASTGALYASATHPLNELQDQPAPVDVYGLSKLLGEQICSFFNVNTGLNCRVARFFNAYGPYETNPHLIPHIMESLRKGPSIELGNLHTKRDYVYVEDMANILFRYSQIDGEKQTIMNIGTGVEYSAEEIVECVADLLGTPIKILSNPKRTRQVDKQHQIADTTKLIELVGYSPKHTLRDGLKKLLTHEGLL
jgi:UDP-glucose 4-epimerase